MIVKHLYVELLPYSCTTPLTQHMSKNTVIAYNSTFVDVLLYVVMQDYKYTMVSLKNKAMLLFFMRL